LHLSFKKRACNVGNYTSNQARFVLQSNAASELGYGGRFNIRLGAFLSAMPKELLKSDHNYQNCSKTYKGTVFLTYSV